MTIPRCKVHATERPLFLIVMKTKTKQKQKKETEETRTKKEDSRCEIGNMSKLQAAATDYRA